MSNLADVLDRHWLAQRIETGIAYCTCGEWEFYAASGQHPLPTLGERFLPFSEHVAAAVLAALEPHAPPECGICGHYTAEGVEVHAVCLNELRAAPTLRAAM